VKRSLGVRNLVFLLALVFLCSKIIESVVLACIFGNAPVLTRQAEPTSESFEQFKLPRKTYTVISRRNIFNSEIEQQILNHRRTGGISLG
jgi:hypothetical protein